VENGTEVLLDGCDTRRRLLQQALVIAGGVLSAWGVMRVGLGHGAARGVGVAAAVFGVVLLVAASRVLVRWEVLYGGHVIRFENSPVFGERLIIDGERITNGPFGYRKVLEGTIRRGTHAGKKIRAESVAGIFQLRCKLTLEPG